MTKLFEYPTETSLAMPELVGLKEFDYDSFDSGSRFSIVVDGYERQDAAPTACRFSLLVQIDGR